MDDFAFVVHGTAADLRFLDGAIDPSDRNGDVVDLHATGILVEFTSGNSYVQIDSSVKDFAIAGNGDVVDMHATGVLIEFTAFRSGSSFVGLEGPFSRPATTGGCNQ